MRQKPVICCHMVRRDDRFFNNTVGPGAKFSSDRVGRSLKGAVVDKRLAWPGQVELRSSFSDTNICCGCQPTNLGIGFVDSWPCGLGNNAIWIVPWVD